MNRRACGVLALLAALLSANRAHAQALTLLWSAPSTCPNGAYVEARVGALIGAPAHAALHVVGRIEKSGPRFVLELSLEGDSYRAQRRLKATRCHSLADASAWLIAVALDPTLAARAPAAPLEREDAVVAPPPRSGDREHERGSEDAQGAAPATPSAAAPSEAAAGEASRAQTAQAAPGAARAARGVAEQEPRSSRAPVRRLSFRTRVRDQPRWWRVGVFTGVWQASLPRAQASVGGRASYGMGLLSLELRGAAHLPRVQGVRESVRARYASQELSSALCAQWGGRLRGGPCAAFALLRSTGSVRGTTDPRREELLWGSGGVAVQLGYNAAQWLELLGEIGVMLPLTPRPRFTIEGVGEVAQAAPLSVYARVGFGFRAADKAPPSPR